MRSLLNGILMLSSVATLGQAPAPTAADIMARVVANQERAEAERLRYVYVQHARVASRKGRTVRCEEVTDTRVTPQATGSVQTLLTLRGRLLRSGRYIDYDKLPQPSARDKTADAATRKQTHEWNPDDDEEMDRDLVENLRKNLTDDKSKNGLHASLFPLTAKAQAEYEFRLKGRERRNGADTFHLTFTPRDNSDYSWRGDVWVDTAAYQPVLVQTALAKNLPLAVRMLMGTSLPGLGFAATYAAQPDGVWFPVSFGTEFKINVLFFFHRTITMAIENRDFQKTHVSSRIVEEGAAEPAQP